MPRQPRLDTPGALHHVMGRGSERTRVFRDDTDRADFVSRLAALGRGRQWSVYAWALMPNHFHLLVRTGDAPLSQSMQRLLTGYVVNFNRRHRRSGHLFRNRYKSIVCEDDPYLLELTRYIHLNPLRVGRVKRLAALRGYPWTGHAALLGGVDRDWQDTATVLAHFGPKRRRAVERYAAFVREGIPHGRRSDLGGGGLIRSAGGWAQVRALRRKGITVASDERILGRGAFTAHRLAEAARQAKATWRVSRKRVALARLARAIGAGAGVPQREFRSGSRKRGVVRARRVFCRVAVKGLGYSGARVARFLGLTTSAANRLAVSEESPEFQRYINAL